MLRLLRHSRREFLKAGVGGAVAWPVFGWRQAVAAPSELSFLAVGDWGRDGARQQRAVATEMGKTAAASGSRFTLSVGDNFYNDGVVSVDDPHWRTSFEAVYDAPSLQAPWYAVLGNHDYHGNPQAQLDYSVSSSRWRMPARYYTRTETLADGEQAEFFHIDTSPLLPNYRGTKVRIDDQDAQAQLTWLETALGKSSARWKIAVGHHPVFSGGSDHGSQPDLIRDLKPLFDRHGVRAYFFGHDHDLQHIVVDGVHYLGCGAGADTRPTSMIAGSLFASDHPGYFSGSLGSDMLRFAFIDNTGATIYEAAISVRA